MRTRLAPALAIVHGALGTIANSLILNLILWLRYRRIVATDGEVERERAYAG